MDKKKKNAIGYLFLFLWAVLILAGIVAKRVYHHPDLMVFYHLPAAVFLVLSWCSLSRGVRERYAKELRLRNL